MNLDAVPIWVFFVGTVLLVLACIEGGYQLGRLAHRRADDEKEAPASGVSGAVLGLTAFILAFTFAIVAERFDTRKQLVRDDANAIRVAYLRADFLPQPDRNESKRLLAAYLDRRVAFTSVGDAAPEQVAPVLAEADRIQRRLWTIAVAHARGDLNSDVGALYVEALNELSEVHASRLAIGVRMRVPVGVWVVLYSLLVLGMLSVGYHTGISGSRRSKASFILATAFSVVIAFIASLDQPGGFVQVTQQPLLDLQQWIAADR